MPKAKSRTVGIYVRISQDRDGTSAAPERQLRDCLELVERKGWAVGEVYEDRDESAYSKSAKRPSYKRMLGDLQSGRIDAVCVFKLDRLARRLTETNRVVALLDDLGAELLSVSDSLDTSTPIGRAMVGFLAAQAETESLNASTRIKRAVADEIARGEMPKGGSRCFGYANDGTIVADEAKALRRMADLFLGGTSFRQIAITMNAEGVLSTRGNGWESRTVAQLLKSPRIGGYRVAADGKTLVRGSWRPIIDGERWRALQAATAKARKPAQRAHEATHLTTGIAHCGRCGGRLSFLKYLGGNGNVFPRLSCVKEPNRPNCGGLAASEVAVDRVVVDRLLKHLAEKQQEPEVDTAAMAAALADDRQALDDLTAERFVRRTITQPIYEKLSTELADRIALAEADLDRATSLAVGIRMDVRSLTKHAMPIGARAKWSAASFEQQRALLRSEVERIVIHPAAHRGGNVFDDRRVEVIFR